MKRQEVAPDVGSRWGLSGVSAWKGEEYKGRVSCKPQVSTWNSGPILTSDGIKVELAVSIWWRINDAARYIAAIASGHADSERQREEDLSRIGQDWIQKLASASLREEINKLPAEKLISPYAQWYLQVRKTEDGRLVPEGSTLLDFSEQLKEAKEQLDKKTSEYGLKIERVEIQELKLPPTYAEKLESVRVAFLEPVQSRALTEAQLIALQGLTSVLGVDAVKLIEILKHVDLSGLGMNPFTGVVPIVQPIVSRLHDQVAQALPSGGTKALPPEEASGEKSPGRKDL